MTKRHGPHPEAETDEAVEFLENFHPGGPWHVVTMVPDGRPNATTVYNTRFNDLKALINEHHGKENIYFHVNRLRPGVQNVKAKKEDIAEIVALHVDVDDTAALDRIRSYVLKPSVIVFSGGGYQAFWFLWEPSREIERAENCNRAIAKYLGGDNCHNVDRIMRVPGTKNLPNAKKRAAGRVEAAAGIVEADLSRRYTLDDFPTEPDPGPAGPKGAVANAASIVPISLAALPSGLSPATRTLIEAGDDLQRPRSGSNPRFPSRSETVFRVACELARLGCPEEHIAGILLNTEYLISASVLEKKSPKSYALKQARAAICAVKDGWPDVDRRGGPTATMRNTVVALQRLDLNFSFDLFRHRKFVGGAVLDEFQGEIGDNACSILRALVIERFNFDPKAENIRDAANQLCLENAFHPVRQMLDGLAWDRVDRLNKWLSTYLGAEDNPLNQAVGRIMLIAAVRRVRDPGVKFDTIVILEGRQGSGKSTALQILAGPENHSDNEILSLDTKSQMEAMEGVWIYEIGEIAGLRKAEIERTKAFASRHVDRGRMAYGRFSEARPRQLIFVGTTNESRYLRDLTGNRRFLPVKTANIDLEALRRDRDQLWAEAACREARGASILIPEELWAAAAVEQEERLEEDPWLENLAAVQGQAFGEEVRAFSNGLLGETLGIPAERQHVGHTKRLAGLMRSLGWEAGKFKVAGKTLRGFRRPKPKDHVDDKPKF